MKSQFDKISAVLQDLQGENYDYKSIMHYDSTAFSRNGRNTIETVENGFTQVIGTAQDLSPLDIIKNASITSPIVLILLNIAHVLHSFL
uniref:Astacin domain-containing protein n=1 Tax=Caenorhabditis tropicalis TaxID=1561998 RepID=A0A1I7V4M1_9PELO